MTYVPLVYFGCLSIIMYQRHKQLDIATTVSLIFAVSGLFSVLIDINGYRSYDTYKYEISIVPAALYCILLTLCILPLAKCDIFSRIQIESVRNVKLIKLLSVVSIIWFVLTVYFSWDRFLFILMSGDMAEIRNDLYKGIAGDSWMLSLPGPVRFTFALLNLLFGCPWVLIFLGFYSMIGNRVPLLYSYFFLIASLSGPYNGILGVDRSSSAYWIMSAVTLFILFRNQLPSKVKKQISILGLVAFVGVIAYLAAMTISRFGERDSGGGALGSLISYFGQSYINFCYFFDEYDLPYHHFGVVFPFTSQYIFGIPSGGVNIQQEMTFLSNKATGVFYTFIGQMIIGIGQFWAIIMTMAYSFFSFKTLGNINRKNEVDIMSLYLYFAFASVVLLGIFGHYYAGPSKTFSLVAMYFVMRILRK